jgi:hypothetical protein
MDQAWVWVVIAVLVVAVLVVALLRGRARSGEAGADRADAVNAAAAAAAGGAAGAVGAAGVAASAARADTERPDAERPDTGRPEAERAEAGPAEGVQEAEAMGQCVLPSAAAPEAEPSPSDRAASPTTDSALAAIDRRRAGTAAPPTFEKAAAVVADAATKPGPYDGSAMPAADGSAPSAEYPIKAKSPYFVRTRGDLWFQTVTAAEAAGFTAWNSR